MDTKRIGLFVMAACVWLSSAALAGPPPGMPDGWSDGFVYANGIRIHYYHATPQPGKPVVLMVHGASDIGLSWATLTQDLQKSYDIYMTDTRGHGLSDPFSDTDNGETLIKDTVEFIRAMKFDKPILLGHSLGAGTVMRVGAEYPDLPRAVIMLDPGLGRQLVGAPAAAPAAAATALPANPATNPLAIAMVGAPQALVRQNNYAFDDLVAKCGHDNPMWDPLDCQYWALSKKQYHGPYTLAQSQAMRGTMTTNDALARISVPALILKADAPPDIRKANEQAASVMKNGKVVHVDGAKHNLHHDKRAKTVELLTQFLNRL